VCCSVVAKRLAVGREGVLQCVAVRCSVLQYVALYGSMLQCVAVCCSVLQCVAMLLRSGWPLLLRVCCSEVHGVAVWS